ncbi:MAG: GAF domain-containing protein [Roseiflexaceae bacterium]|nr:GAF domain-containing protein [Roseiflexaceae bacterium]
MPRRRLYNQSQVPEDVATNPDMVGQVRTLLAEAQALSARLAALNEVTVAMQANLEFEEILQTFARESRWVLDFQVSSIALRGEQTYTERVLRASPGYQHSEQRCPVHTSVIGRVLAQGQALLLFEREEGMPANTESALILPLRNGNTIVGTINFYARAAHAYSIDDLRIAYALAAQIAVVIQNARLLNETRVARDELNTVLESISDAVLVVDTAGTVLLTNGALRQLLGVGDYLCTGKPLIRLLNRLIHQEHPSRRRQLLQTIRTQRRQQKTGTLKLRETLHIEWATTPMSGNNTGYMITARDISARVGLEKLREEMTSMLVHDLRTPLTGLIMGLDILRMYADQPQSPDFMDVLGQSRSSAQRLLKLINTILDVGKMQSSQVTLALFPHYLLTLVEQALQAVQVMARSSRQEVTIQQDDDLPMVEVDSDIVERVIENILSNASKFSPPGGAIRIHIRRFNDAFVELSVSDSGPGIAPEQRDHIFELYGQVASMQSRRGTGIGLTFCRLAVEAHGGSIGIRDGIGTGSTFWLTLPIYTT